MERMRVVPGLLAASSLFCLSPCLLADVSVSLSGSLGSPQPVGALVQFTAQVSGSDPGPFVYRFRTAPTNGSLHVLIDYGPKNSMDWTASASEGDFEIEVTARSKSSGASGVASLVYSFTSRVAGDQPVISPTANPLVFLYSAPPCPAGKLLEVQVREAAGSQPSPQLPPEAHGVKPKQDSNLFVPGIPCTAGASSMNVYIAGLQAGSQYAVKPVTGHASVRNQEAELSFSAGAVPDGLATAMATIPAPASSPDPVVLFATLFTPAIATDLQGNLIWYYPGDITFITRPEKGGLFFGVKEDPKADQSGQLMREFDLTGMTVLETNAARVNEQLTAMGKRSITAFHHEARRLSNGKIAVLAGVEQILTDVQGPGPVDVLGDMILVLDNELNVVWTWDAFDHLDTSRQATLGDTCLPGDCPPTFLGGIANDWTHGNALSETADGNLLYSTRSQDWVIKINYDHGEGDGTVLWKLGQDGDFTIESSDPSPWFSHQHDPSFEPGTSKLDIFDDGNVRNSADPNATSRGQVYLLNETNRTAKLVLNADMGLFSFALGSAQLLPNGDHHFDVGYLTDGTSESVEVDGSGTPVYEIHCSAPSYRSFRLPNLYTTP